MSAILEASIASAIVDAQQRRVEQHEITNMLYEFADEQDQKEERELAQEGNREEV